MHSQEKINQLKTLIEQTLDPILDGEFILTDLPYHTNIGDILIWQGENDYLKSRGLRCLGQTSAQTFQFPDLKPSTIILLNGGGNFGDLWTTSQEFRLKIISRYKRNRVVLFPQSVWYENKNLISKDAQILADHKDLILCARDHTSFNFFSTHFKNKVLLVPDMAFYLNRNLLTANRNDNHRTSQKSLYLKRTDKEFVNNDLFIDRNLLDVHDWPTMEKKLPRLIFMQKYLACYRRLRQLSFLGNYWGGAFLDWYVANFIKYFSITLGCNLIYPYQTIFTTRLHVMILSIFFNKNIIYLDNVSGKLSAFAATWLSDLDSVKKFQR